jgi:hypothetical protein
VTSPATDSESATDRIANVSAVLIASPDEKHTEALASDLSSLFVHVALVPGEPSGEHSRHAGQAALRELLSALASAHEERVLVVSAEAPHPTPHLWLGLCAWPEHDVVTPGAAEDANSFSALYRRGPALATARAQLEAGVEAEDGIAASRSQALQGVADALDSQMIEGADLLALNEDES